MPGMMSPNLAEFHSVLSPNLAAIALNRSTSKPCTVLPSAARNSLGAYVESVPIMITPAFFMLSGSLLARSTFWLTETDGAVPPPDSPLNELEPQALNASAATEAAATPSLIRTFMCLLLPSTPGPREPGLINTCAPLLSAVDESSGQTDLCTR